MCKRGVNLEIPKGYPCELLNLATAQGVTQMMVIVIWHSGKISQLLTIAIWYYQAKPVDARDCTLLTQRVVDDGEYEAGTFRITNSPI